MTRVPTSGSLLTILWVCKRYLCDNFSSSTSSSISNSSRSDSCCSNNSSPGLTRIRYPEHSNGATSHAQGVHLGNSMQSRGSSNSSSSSSSNNSGSSSSISGSGVAKAVAPMVVVVIGSRHWVVRCGSGSSSRNKRG